MVRLGLERLRLENYVHALYRGYRVDIEGYIGIVEQKMEIRLYYFLVYYGVT